LEQRQVRRQKDKESPLSNGSTMTYHSERSFQIKEKDGSANELKMSSQMTTRR